MGCDVGTALLGGDQHCVRNRIFVVDQLPLRPMIRLRDRRAWRATVLPVDKEFREPQDAPSETTPCHVKQGASAVDRSRSKAA